MRLELRDASSDFDVVFERAPALKSVFARDDELRVGELERRVEHGPRIGVREARMVRRDARGGCVAPFAMEVDQLFRLELELRETRALGKRLAGHTAPFVECPSSAVRAERSDGCYSLEKSGGTRSLSADGRRPARSTVKIAGSVETVN
jgi:hypothetical protein